MLRDPDQELRNLLGASGSLLYNTDTDMLRLWSLGFGTHFIGINFLWIFLYCKIVHRQITVRAVLYQCYNTWIARPLLMEIPGSSGTGRCRMWMAPRLAYAIGVRKSWRLGSRVPNSKVILKVITGADEIYLQYLFALTASTKRAILKCNRRW